jgi:hypothetical protein
MIWQIATFSLFWQYGGMPIPKLFLKIIPIRGEGGGGLEFSYRLKHKLI